MEPENIFKLAAAAVAVAEAFEEWVEDWGVSLYSDVAYDLKEAFEEYQHIRDRG